MITTSLSMIDRILYTMRVRGLTANEADAVALINAMREPTDEMAEAGFQFTGDPCWQDDVKRAWRAMIDESLGGKLSDDLGKLRQQD
jgi:hypothetical protein